MPGLAVTDARASSPGLQHLAVGSPAKEKTQGSSREVKWVKKRGDIDISQFSLPTFEIDARASRFPKKMNAAECPTGAPNPAPSAGRGGCVQGSFWHLPPQVSSLMLSF